MPPETATRRDIFDQISPGDIFDRLKPNLLKEFTPAPRVAVQLTSEIRDLIKAEIGGLLKQAVAEAIKDIKPRTIETKTIERIVEKSIPTPEKIIIKEKLDDKELQRTIDEKVQKATDEKSNVFIPAPVGIPSMSGQSGKVLSTDGNQARWIASSGATSAESYTTSNVTTRRTLNANDTSLDELADFIASLVVDLQAIGLVQ